MKTWKYVTLAAVLVLAACGNPEAATDKAASPQTTPKADTNPLATQQQALRDAKGVQAILDKDAKRKKAALDNLD